MFLGIKIKNILIYVIIIIICLQFIESNFLTPKIQGEAFFGEKGKKIDALTKSEASKMIDEVISHYGRIMY